MQQLSPDFDAPQFDAPKFLRIANHWRAPESYAVRRWLVLGFCVLLYGAMLASLYDVLHKLGFDGLAFGMMACFVLAAPWTVLGVCNGLLGAVLVFAHRRGQKQDVALQADITQPHDPFPIALVMTLRNEDADRAFMRLKAMAEDLAHARAQNFAIHVLSDSSKPEVIAQEEALFSAWQSKTKNTPHYPLLFYRRRAENIGFKAGNLREFCLAHVQDYEAFVPLDADSFMSAEVLQNLRVLMATRPNLGLIQTLVVGAPTRSAFARLFQFGMRAGMRSYTLGGAWWQGDCGPFWGHNALVRMRPFVEACVLPVLPGKPPLGGAILSHDQVEAVLMRKAGFEVRVVAEECASYEDNPPDLAAFISRDQRWAQGNMQYWRLLLERQWLGNILPMSRVQLIWAIMLFIGTPAIALFILLAAMKAAMVGAISPAVAHEVRTLYGVYVLMHLLPKLVGFGDVLLSAEQAQRYGVRWWFAVGAVTELIASFVINAATSFATGLFLLGLPFGIGTGWASQKRDSAGLSWRVALAQFWLQTLFGLVVSVLVAQQGVMALIYASPFTLAYLVTLPFAVLTAHPKCGAWLARHKFCAMPEEFEGLVWGKILDDNKSG